MDDLNLSTENNIVSQKGLSNNLVINNNLLNGMKNITTDLGGALSGR